MRSDLQNSTRNFIDLQQNVRSALGGHISRKKNMPAIRPFLAVFSDQDRLYDPARHLQNSVTHYALTDFLVIFRSFTTESGREARARRLVRLCRSRGWTCLVATDWRLAYRVGAHGVHLPSRSLYQVPGLRLKFPHWQISASAHNERERVACVKQRVDIAFLTPIYPTHSHPGALYLGTLRTAMLTQRIRRESPTLKIAGLGGITAHTIHPLRSIGLHGVGCISAAI